MHSSIMKNSPTHSRSGSSGGGPLRLPTFDGFPAMKSGLKSTNACPEDEKELLTAVVTPTGGLTNCPASLPDYRSQNSHLSNNLSTAIFGCLSLGIVLHIIGISTTAWSSKWRYREGLWESCTCDSSQNQIQDWFRGTQILISLGMFTIALSVAIAACYVWLPRLHQSATLYIISALCFLAGFFLFIGIAVFGAHRDHLSRSYYMTAFACAFSILASFITLYQLRRTKLRE